MSIPKQQYFFIAIILFLTSLLFANLKAETNKPLNNKNTLTVQDSLLHGGSNSMHFPYPVILIHGMAGSANTWANLRNHAIQQGWTYGGQLPFCLNGDGDNTTEDISSPSSIEIKNFIPLNLPPADFYAINFNVDTNGISYGSDTTTTTLSSQAATIKEGKALGMAIKAVLQATGKNKVILLGHSSGGFAERSYLQNSNFWQTDGQHHVAKAITAGTAHGGSNTSGGILLSAYAGIDENSDAVRDVRTSYYYSGSPGVCLFGGIENASVMNDSFINNFYSFDVNCNGTIGETVVGLNQMPIPSDLDYACILSNYHLDSSCGDLVVSCVSANIKTSFPLLLSETFTVDAFHTAIPSEINAEYLALDEPDTTNLSYEIDTNIIYNGFITIQAPDAQFSRDNDNYLFFIGQQGVGNIIIKNIPVNNFGFSVIEQLSGSILYTNSTATGDTSLISPPLSFSTGDYYLKIWGDPTISSWKTPYNFIVNFEPSANSINPFNYEENVGLNIFPNPTTDNIIIETSQNAEIEILNIEGQTIKYFISNEKITKIDVSGILSGMYFVKVKTKDGIAIKKFIKLASE